MPGRIAARLAELGLELPPAPMPAANYVPYVVTGNLVFIAGQVSGNAQGHHKGKLGAELTVEQGQAAAKACALNILAQLAAACGGDLDRVKRAVKLGGFVNCVPEFDQMPAVVNGASDLMVAVLGDAGRHARFAVGAPNLPMNYAVEIDAVFEIA